MARRYAARISTTKTSTTTGSSNTTWGARSRCGVSRNIADPAAFVQAVEVVRTRFGLSQLVAVGDRRLITSARNEALRELGGIGWLTALRATALAALGADAGPLQLGLFD
jgi:hypothetical protein